MFVNEFHLRIILDAALQTAQECVTPHGPIDSMTTEHKCSPHKYRGMAVGRSKAKGKEKVLTAILPATEFYPASIAHQKYYLQQDPVLLQSLPEKDRLDTVLAAKLNAVSGRAGERSDLEKTMSELGIDVKSQDVLFARAVWDSI